MNALQDYQHSEFRLFQQKLNVKNLPKMFFRGDYGKAWDAQSWIEIVRAARRDSHETEHDGRGVCQPSGNAIAAWVQQNCCPQAVFAPELCFFDQASLATLDETAGVELPKDADQTSLHRSEPLRRPRAFGTIALRTITTHRI